MQPLSFDTTKNVISAKRLQELAHEYGDTSIYHLIRRSDATFQEFQMRDLEGVDLTKRKVVVWSRNYEDSQWMASRNVLTVNMVPLSEGDDSRYPSYLFIMANADNLDIEEDQLRYTTFWAVETVIVVTEH